MPLPRCHRIVLLIVFSAMPWIVRAAWADPPSRKPNFVILLCDNLGYGDVGCFGSQLHRTPHIDRMASEGVRLTHFYSCSGVCTPSRAALMTASYPRRVGLDFTDPDGHVLRPVSPNGLHPDETTIAEVLKQQGYATACIGKWHLGDQPEFLPTQQGFDRYVGIPYSDDMTPRPQRNWPPLPLMHDETVIEAPVDRDQLTRRYTEWACEFIRQHRDESFFLYLPHAMPGSTQAPFASEAFRGKSKNGPYGDSVEELDWSTGQILDLLRELELDRHTLVIWTSDNGAPRRRPPQGSNQPLGGWGYTTQEGGMRVPCIAWWPGTIPAGRQCDELATMMDWLPTFALWADQAATLPPAIDGHDIRGLLTQPATADSPYEAFYYYHTNRLQAVRSGPWKLVVDDQAMPQALFNVVTDPGETNNQLDQHAGEVSRLNDLLTRVRDDLGEGGQLAPGRRPVGRVENPTPRVLPPSDN